MPSKFSSLNCLDLHTNPLFPISPSKIMVPRAAEKKGDLIHRRKYLSPFIVLVRRTNPGRRSLTTSGMTNSRHETPSVWLIFRPVDLKNWEILIIQLLIFMVLFNKNVYNLLIDYYLIQECKSTDYKHCRVLMVSRRFQSSRSRFLTNSIIEND